jgi:hypothetical protein
MEFYKPPTGENMSKLSKIFFRAMLVVAIGFQQLCATAGGTKIESGSLAFLQQEQRVNLEYDYSNMEVGRNVKDCLPEQEFIASQVTRLNAKKTGEGDAWRLEWIGQRTSRLQPRFKQMLNKQFAADSIPLEFGEFKDAKYTLILKPKTMLQRSLTADVLFIKTGNRTNVLAVVKMVNISGDGDYGVPDSSKAYANVGKDLGILIRGKIK